MFDWCHRLVSLVVLAAPALLPTRSAAQAPDPRERHVARLAALRDDAARALARADSARAERLDTIRAGGLTILARAPEAPTVRRAAARSWISIDSLYGDAAAPFLKQPLLFWLMTRPIRYRPPGTERLQGVMAPDNATDDDVTRQLTRGAALAIRSGTDSVFVNWLGVMLEPVERDDAERARVYVELLTAPAAVVRRCHEGDLISCRWSLDLVDREDRATIWYDAVDRRSLVRKTSELQRARHRANADACLIARADTACLEVLHAVGWVEPPLSSEARHELARLAMYSGGRSAYQRLLRSAGRPLADRLAIAAGLSTDSLMQRWRGAVLAARPRPVTLTAPLGWVALGWATVFGLLALRSTRWR